MNLAIPSYYSIRDLVEYDFPKRYHGGNFISLFSDSTGSFSNRAPQILQIPNSYQWFELPVTPWPKYSTIKVATSISGSSSATVAAAISSTVDDGNGNARITLNSAYNFAHPFVRVYNTTDYNGIHQYTNRDASTSTNKTTLTIPVAFNGHQGGAGMTETIRVGTYDSSNNLIEQQSGYNWNSSPTTPADIMTLNAVDISKIRITACRGGHTGYISYLNYLKIYWE